MTNQPLTDAVYGKRSARRAPRPKPAPRRYGPGRTIASALGEEIVAKLYRKLGYKRPQSQRRRPRKAAQP